MSNNQSTSIPQGKKRKKKKFRFGLIYLFLFIFLSALAGFSYLVKLYSPDIDVTIGNNEAMTLGESEMDFEVKSIDERLKWIQMEDELPTVAVRGLKEKMKNDDELSNDDKEEKDSDSKKDKEENADKQNKKPPLPTLEDIKKTDFREIPAAVPEKVIPAPKPSITKVYMGSYPNIEEATAVQNEISKIDPSLAPYIKSTGGNYIVQIGSFADRERAVALVAKLKSKGLSPKVNYEN